MTEIEKKSEIRFPSSCGQLEGGIFLHDLV